MLPWLRRLDCEMWTYSLLSFLIAHTIADFAIRSEFLKNDRRAPSQPVAYHLLAFFAISSLVLVANPVVRGQWPYVGTVVLAGCLVHLFIDLVVARGGMWAATVGRGQRRLFTLQQAAKLAVLAALATVIADRLSVPGMVWEFTPELWRSTRPLAYVFGYAFAVFAGDAFVSLMLTYLEWKPGAKEGGLPGAGRIIGIFEALLVTTFVVGCQYSAVGFALTAKSIARFEWLKDQKKTEYFLIGTLSNIAMSVLGGILALWLAGQSIFPE